MSVLVRLDLSDTTTQRKSGVGNYTELLAKALSRYKDISIDLITKPTFATKVYRKLDSYGFASAYDKKLNQVDLTIFPNFATWPTINSKLVATVIHDLTYLYFPEVVEEKNLAHLRRVVPRSIKKADFIITVSESVKAELVKEFQLDPKKCIVTPIPPDEAFFSTASAEARQIVRKKYNLDPLKKYIYFIGNLEPRKNLKTLIEAYQLLPQALKDEYSLVLAGGKGWKTEETEMALQNAVKSGEDIKHIGFIDQQDSPILYQEASLFVMPSLYEGFGMPILEAMASGTPVIASSIPVLKEVAGTFATYADPQNPESFKDAIIDTLSVQKPSRKELQKNVTRYSWENNVSTIIKAVHSLQ